MVQLFLLYIFEGSCDPEGETHRGLIAMILDAAMKRCLAKQSTFRGVKF